MELLKESPVARRWLFIGTLGGALVLPISGRTAGFDCNKAASATEKAICRDESLSKMDGQMAALWGTLRAKSSDPAIRQAQRQWLEKRDACGGDVACLTKTYQQRLGELQEPVAGSVDRRSAPPRFQQTWELDSRSETVASELKITGTKPLHFELHAEDGGNVGELEGSAIQDSRSHARYKQPGCQLDFVLQGERLIVDEKETAEKDGCGAGMGVSYDGSYITAKQFASRPAANLQTLEIVPTVAEDAAIHKLLGNDYATLVGDVNEVSTDTAMGTTTTTLWVRGLGGISGAILMNHEGLDFWIGLLVPGSDHQIRMRYYTNVTQDKKTLPKPIRDWHEQSGKTIPIDMMP